MFASCWKTSECVDILLLLSDSFDRPPAAMMKALGQVLFSSGLQSPKYSEEEKKVNVSQVNLQNRTVNLWSVCHTDM